ncbi:MAG: hypothetical protein IJ840_04470 [Bacteroidales bacterium]|nr:hypothetical protein [Bacteroidales bacterium]
MKKILAAIAFLAALMSCVNVNEKLGGDFIATNMKYDFHSAEFELNDVWMKPADSLSAYSSRRINFGAIRDETFGLFRRGCAIVLVPVLNDVDFGDSPIFQRFRFQAEIDSVSVSDPSQSNILQNVYVYEITEPLDPKKYYSNTEVRHGPKRITKGVPIVNGIDSLTFEFTSEFGQKYLNITSEDMSDFEKYTSKFPGIYLTTNDPDGVGGRFNLFKMNILEASTSSSYSYPSRTDNYAVMYFSGIYDGERRDTSMMFYFSPLEFQDLNENISTNTLPDQYVFNVDSHESGDLAGKADDILYVEGGSGLKPVISADEIRRLVLSDISSKGADPATALISKATVEMPFDFPEDYRSMYLYPDILSPTIKISTDSSVVFAGLTDASASDENEGNINRSLCVYAPDITHHVQQIIRQKDKEDISDYDIWMLIMHVETTTTTNADASQMANYYQQIAYASYANQLYGGGYGGYYGGYGGYGYGGYGGYGYNNYYNYMMMAQYAAASATTTSTSSELDKDRFYKCALRGPGAAGGPTPKLKITYAVPKE